MISRLEIPLFVNKLLSVSLSTDIILFLLSTLSLLYRPLVNLESSPSLPTLSVCLSFFVRLSLHLYLLYLSVSPSLSVSLSISTYSICLSLLLYPSLSPSLHPPYPCISLCQSLYPSPLLQSNTNAFLRLCSAWISSVRPNQVKSIFFYPVL